MSLGKATSLAPIISGSRKLPSVVGIDGTRKNHTITVPCSVKRRLYSSAVTKSPLGVNSSMRIATAAAPPRKKKKVMPIA